MDAPWFLPKYTREKSEHFTEAFIRDRVFWAPIHPHARFVVLLNRRPYAGYDTEEEAQDAVRLWKAHWPAAKEASFMISVRG